MSYDPALHHRRSIRLKGHDYAGGGVYFVTICEHRELVSATGGKPLAGALRALTEERLRITAEKCPQMSWVAWVIMPDHFHALVRMQEGPLRLGNVIGGFKAAVSREWNRARDGAAQWATQRATRVSPVRRGEACLAASLARGAVQPQCAENRQAARGGCLFRRLAFAERKRDIGLAAEKRATGDCLSGVGD